MSQEFDQLNDTINAIRHPIDGCPWNLKQDHHSLKRYLLEELYEVLEAIDSSDYAHLEEELGDLLLQIALHSKLAEEKGQFDLNSVAARLNDKMIKRHPHVFADDKAETSQEVDKHWDREKAKEKSNRESIFEGIPRELPALASAWKISKKAVKQSFEWDKEDKLFAQLKSELTELDEIVQAARLAGNDPYQEGFTNEEQRQAAELELGDILFTVVNIARWYKIDPEEALRQTNKKFVRRFDCMMKIASKELSSYSIAELEALWQEAKKRS
jgi:tetrapyrrole methylase family protein / MazG family protein